MVTAYGEEAFRSALAGAYAGPVREARNGVRAAAAELGPLYTVVRPSVPSAKYSGAAMKICATESGGTAFMPY